jgi:hypothetical protein
MHRMPAIIRQEGKLQLRDQDMVDLIEALRADTAANPDDLVWI